MSTLVKVSSYHSVLMLCEPLDDVDAMYLGKVSDARLLLCINLIQLQNADLMFIGFPTRSTRREVLKAVYFHLPRPWSPR